MSETDSFIDEVTEEVRRDRLFGYMRRYGWIAVLAVLLLVGGAAWNEWRKAAERNRAEAFGDAIMSALGAADADARAEALSAIEPPSPQARVVVDLLRAGELAETDPERAAELLLNLADNPEAPEVYRQIATLKAVAIPGSGLSEENQRMRLDGLALAGGLVRLLAEEQLAMLDIAADNNGAALSRLRRIADDAEATADLRERVAQAIVALGGEMSDAGNHDG